MAGNKGVKFRINKKLINSPISYGFTPSKVNIDVYGIESRVGADDSVIAGEVIAEGKDGFAVHSSINGKVLSVGPDVITIEAVENQGEFKNMPLFENKLSVDNRAEMLEYIARAGITFEGKPFHSILTDYIEKGTSRLVINCMECLPTNSVSYRTVYEMPSEVIGGAKILLSLLGIRTGVFAIEKSKKKLASVIEKQSYDKEMFIISLMPSVYPMDYDRCISREIFYSTDKNKVLTVTPALCLQVYDAFVYGIPYVGHTISVTRGSSTDNLYVPSGSMLEEIEEYVSFYGKGSADKADKTDKYGYLQLMAIVNSFVSGESVSADEGYVRPEMNSLVYYYHSDKDTKVKNSCIECGECIKVCPMEINPVFLYDSIRKRNKNKVKLYGIDRCLLCGCCSYVCPVGVAHIEAFKSAKREVDVYDKD